MKPEQKDVLRELYTELDNELRRIKEERKNLKPLTYREQQLSKQIPGLLIAKRQILKMFKAARKEQC